MPAMLVYIYIKTTYDGVLCKSFWPEIKSDMVKYSCCCHICQRGGTQSSLTDLLLDHTQKLSEPYFKSGDKVLLTSCHGLWSLFLSLNVEGEYLWLLQPLVISQCVYKRSVCL